MTLDYLSERCLVLDGGLGTYLESRGNSLQDQLWSARLLRDDPAEISSAHRDFLAAGADIISTASYQATVTSFTDSGIGTDEAKRLLRLSVELAQSSRDEFWTHASNHSDRCRPLVAASVGPYGAYLANGAEYTGNYNLDRQGLDAFHRDRWQLLAKAKPDIMFCETIPSLAEAEVLLDLALETSSLPVWVSFSCRDDQRISDGTPIVNCARLIDRHPRIDVIGVNCTPPQIVLRLIQRIRDETDKPIVVYPNSGASYNAQEQRWSGDQDIADFAQRASTWSKAGARIIGGCCRTTPAHIAAVRRILGTGLS